MGPAPRIKIFFKSVRFPAPVFTLLFSVSWRTMLLQQRMEEEEVILLG
jgi:hypothetical protein